MALRAILDIVLPPACAACGLPGAGACAGCLATLRPMAGPWCTSCGAPHATANGVARCGECRGRLTGARQALYYSGAAPALIAALKDHGRRDLAPILARVTARHIPPPPAGVVLVPVPLSRARQRRRGYNQAALLAEALGRQWNRPVAHLLQRTRETPPQRGARRSARIRQAAGSYAARPGAPAARYPVLIDDVRTTGATLAACAAALHRAGALRVGAICTARAAPEPSDMGTMGRASEQSVLSTREGCDAAAGEGEERFRHRRPLRSRRAQARAADEDPAGVRR